MKAALILLLGMLVSGCGTVLEGCELPWDSIEQMQRCVSRDYEITETGDDLVNIRVSSKDPRVIAGALADAFLEMQGATVGQVAVWAMPPPEGLPSIQGRTLGPRISSGYLAEFDEGILHFDICTSWEEAVDGGGEICADQIEYDIARRSSEDP